MVLADFLGFRNEEDNGSSLKESTVRPKRQVNTEMFTIQASLSGIQHECSLILSHPLFSRLVCIKSDPVTNLVHDSEHVPSG